MTDIKLVTRYDRWNASDSATLDLMSGLSSTSGIILERDGWEQQIARPGATSVVEVMTLRIKGNDTDDLASKIQAIDALIQQVYRWNNSKNLEPSVWLRVQMTGETGTRQALILSMMSEKVSVLDISAQLESDVEVYRLTIERTPAWEPEIADYVSTYQASDAIDVNCEGGMVELSNVVPGDMPARMARFAVYASNTIRKFWAGFRTDRLGVTPANLQPIWDLTQCVYVGLGADTIVSGDHLITSFATNAALTERCIDIATVAAPIYTSDQQGTFMVLLVAATTDGTSRVRVRMRTGFAYNGSIPNPLYRSLTPITSASKMLYELGTVTFSAEAGDLDYAAIALDAERISGGGALLMYDLILIPVDEGGISFATGDGFSGGELYNYNHGAIFRRADDSIIGYGLVGTYGNSDGSIESVLRVTDLNFAMPDGSANEPLLVIAGQGATFDINTTLTLEYTFAPRWRTLRGDVGVPAP